MSKQLFIVNAAAELLLYKAGVAHTIAGIAAGQREICFSVANRTSLDIDSGEVRRVVKNAHAAGTAQVATATLPVGQPELYIKILKTTIGTQNIPVKTFTGADVAGVVAAITAEAAKPESDFYGFTVSAAAQVVTVTAPIGHTFRLAATAGTTIAYTTPAVPPFGRDVDVSKLEDYLNTYEGATNKIGFPVIRPASRVVAGAQYDVVVVECVLAGPNKDSSEPRKYEDYKLYVAINKALTPGTFADDLVTAVAKLM